MTMPRQLDLEMIAVGIKDGEPFRNASACKHVIEAIAPSLLAEVHRLRERLETIFAMCDPGDVQTPEVLRMGLLYARDTAYEAVMYEPWSSPPALAPLGEIDRLRAALAFYAFEADTEGYEIDRGEVARYALGVASNQAQAPSAKQGAASEP